MLNESLFREPLPTIAGGALLLRPFDPADAPRVQAVLADPVIAANTLTVPHPYPEGEALRWMATHDPKWREGKLATWAVVRRRDALVVAAVSLRITAAHHRAEVGYWVAADARGEGVATSALAMVIEWGFDHLGLHRIEAHHFVENPASGRVMAKAGMQREGRVRGAFFRDGVPRDLDLWAILATDR